MAESHTASRPSIWEIKSTFDNTQTDKQARTLTFILPIKVKVRAGLSVCVLSNADVIE